MTQSEEDANRDASRFFSSGGTGAAGVRGFVFQALSFGRAFVRGGRTHVVHDSRSSGSSIADHDHSADR